MVMPPGKPAIATHKTFIITSPVWPARIESIAVIQIPGVGKDLPVKVFVWGCGNG